MQHMLIGGYIAAVILGFISAHHLNTKYKIHSHYFLKTYAIHVLLLNFIVIFLTATRYFKVNIMSDDGVVGSTRFGQIDEGLFLLRKGIEIFGIIAFTYLLVKTLYLIQNKLPNFEIP